MTDQRAPDQQALTEVKLTEGDVKVIGEALTALWYDCRTSFRMGYIEAMNARLGGLFAIDHTHGHGALDAGNWVEITTYDQGSIRTWVDILTGATRTEDAVSETARDTTSVAEPSTGA